MVWRELVKNTVEGVAWSKLDGMEGVGQEYSGGSCMVKNAENTLQ